MCGSSNNMKRAVLNAMPLHHECCNAIFLPPDSNPDFHATSATRTP
jgi:hypothetical protein